MKAVVLLSGGADSATCLAIARARRREIFALSFDYGQRHRRELACARALARRFDCREHRVVRIELPGAGASALTSRKIAVPRGRARRGTIPVTYVPARNAVFLALSLSWAEALGAGEIWIGANVLDYSGYPDCRPEFLRAFERMANLGTKAAATGRRRFRIVAPLLRMTKEEIFRTGMRLGVDYASTISCYDPRPRGAPCGRCDSCRIRRRALRNIELAR
jgi:7-cyano-7-deazaguanine synthase